MNECAHCGKPHGKSTSAINRAAKISAPLYCDKVCAGIGRRKHKTKAQKVSEKAAYDAQYRIDMAAILKAKKAAYFQATYDPKAAAIVRKARMPYHVEYCQQPEYRKYKRKYDMQYRAKRLFGEFWEAALLVNEIHDAVLQRATWTEIATAKGTLNKWQQRRRDYERINGGKSQTAIVGNAEPDQGR